MAEERFAHYDTILRSLTVMVVKMDGYLANQEATNAELRAFNQQQLAINDRLTAAIERLDTTSARVETLLARLLRHEDNGHDA